MTDEVAEHITIYKNAPFAYLDHIVEHFAATQTSDNFGASNVNSTILSDGRNLKHPYPRAHTHVTYRQLNIKGRKGASEATKKNYGAVFVRRA